jgi:hypothetical protein
MLLCLLCVLGIDRKPANHDSDDSQIVTNHLLIQLLLMVLLLLLLLPPPPGGCKAGSVRSDVTGDALVMEDSSTIAALKATADCLLEGVNTYQYGGESWVDEQGSAGYQGARGDSSQWQ